MKLLNNLMCFDEAIDFILPSKNLYSLMIRKMDRKFIKIWFYQTVDGIIHFLQIEFEKKMRMIYIFIETTKMFKGAVQSCRKYQAPWLVAHDHSQNSFVEIIYYYAQCKIYIFLQTANFYNVQLVIELDIFYTFEHRL